MSITTELLKRAKSKCEMCSTAQESELISFTAAPKTGNSPDDQIALCAICHNQIQNETDLDPNHWRCLNESMWSTVPAVQIMAYRMLKKLSAESWAQDLLNMMYIDEEILEWAQYRISGHDVPVVHRDTNGKILEAGDTVTLIQDLNVKGANFTAKRGTAVRRIRLIHDNEEHIEGKVDGQTIIILTKFVKKS